MAGNWWSGSFFGITGGFSTMIGNTAGPIMSLYLLAMQLPKNVLIGTGAWFFLVINLFKIPFHIFVWKTVTVDSFSINLMLWPVILLGGFIGVRLVRIIPEKTFQVAGNYYDSHGFSETYLLKKEIFPSIPK